MSAQKPLATSSTKHLKTIRASTNELRTARFDAPALPKLEDLDDDCEAILLKRVKRLMAVLGVTDAQR